MTRAPLALAAASAAPALSRKAAAALLISFLFAVAASGIRPLWNNDTGLHVRGGEIVWQTGRVSGVDNLSHTAPDAVFIDHEWLARVVLYLADRAGGVTALVMLKGAIIISTFLLLWRITRENGHAAWLVLLAVGAVTMVRVQMRPHIMSWLLIAALLWFQKRERRDAIVPLLAVWANLHASVVLGLAMTLIWCAERAMADRRYRTWALWGGAYALAPIANPFGAKIFLFMGEIRGHKDFVSEWNRYGVDDPAMWTLALVFALLAFDIARRRENRLFDGARLLLLAGLSASAMRHGSEAMLFIAPIAARRFSGWRVWRVPRVAAAAPWLIAGAAVAGGLFLVIAREGFRIHLDIHALPVRATEFVNRHRLNGEMYNDYNFGGYLLWKTDPPLKVFVDGRLEVYARGGKLDDYLRVSHGAPGWENVLDRYGVDWAIVRADRPIARMLDDSPAWEMVYFDYNAAIFLRAGFMPEVRRVRRFRPWGHRDRDNVAALIDEANYLLAQNPDFFGGYKMRAFIHYRNGDLAAARSDMTEYLRLYPEGMKSKETRRMLENLAARGFWP
ncbi:hypothetical protein K8I61_08080 [bacterium]|nr:hypothetical protein [bacterium]